MTGTVLDPGWGLGSYLGWPWALLLAPLPWLVRRWLPPALPGPREALWLPHYAALEGLHPLEGGDVPDRMLPVLVWVALLLALAQPQWEGMALYRWPLAAALALSALLAARLTRPPRRYRILPGHLRSGEGPP